MIRHRISQFIDKERLFSLRDKVLVALSGGADSVALLRILLSLGYDCEAAHCNFHLRGEESNRDEGFVRELCRELEVPLHVIHFETEQYASEQRISIEMAARELRYQWFNEIMKQCGASVIAVAHHKDDNVETILLNLIRGTGINGLTGIRSKNGYVVRPLLCVSRDELIDYLQHIGQPFVTDSTNLQDEFTRNKIRLKLLPLMQEINPSVKENLIEAASHLSEAALPYQKEMEEGRDRVFLPERGISINALMNEIAPSALLFEILHPLGFNPRQIKSIFNSIPGQSGKEFIGRGWRVIKDRDWLLIEKLEEKKDTRPPFQLIKEVQEYTPEIIIPRDKHTACFDADKLNGEITLRKWEMGDTFIPFGMNGRKLVSDYLTDCKFSRIQKESQWVLCCDNWIAWLVGERTDNRFRIDENTKQMVIYRIECLKEKRRLRQDK